MKTMAYFQEKLQAVNLLNDYSKNLSVLILAAGQGKRMKSEIPKVLHNICFKPILYYILTSVIKINPKNIFIVIGHKKNLVAQYLEINFPQVKIIEQESQLGTANAVMASMKYRAEFGNQTMILPGDIPLISSGTLLEVLLKKIPPEAPVLSLLPGWKSLPDMEGS
jgi:bifunctional UDP-N-acetylglucosamine pyrophosphorylase / glucosamine-1-phosphate N-acetyltransferase